MTLDSIGHTIHLISVDVGRTLVSVDLTARLRRLSHVHPTMTFVCLLYTSDAADES